MQVTLIAALTADGLIGAVDDNRSFNWTTKADKKYYIDAIKRSKLVVTGSRTFGPMKRFPKDMRYIVYTRRPDELVNPRPDLITVEPTQEDPKDLIARLEAEGHEEVTISGGASIYTMFLKAGVVDKMYLSIEPIVFGAGTRLLSEEMEVKLKLDDVRKLGDEGTVVLEYTVINDKNSK